MVHSVNYSLVIIIICVICTQLERALPFIIFKNRDVPAAVIFLGKALPMAVMMTLLVYCLRSTTFNEISDFMPQLISLILIVILHVWKRNTLLSIFAGTVCYMILVQHIF